MITLNAENLPSRTVPYKVKEFNMEWFKPRQLMLLSKAVHLSSIEPVIEAMSQVVSGIDLNDVTVGDFFYMLTLQRLNCFKDRPLNAEWQCGAAVFLRMDGNERYSPADIDELVQRYTDASEEDRLTMENPDDISLEADVCGYANYVPVTLDDFRTIKLGEEVMDEDIDFPRVRTLASYLTMQKDADKAMIADACQYVKAGDSLEQKLQILLDSDDMDFFGRLNDASAKFVHGISREIYKTCADCRHTHPILYTVDANSFFM